MLFSRNTASENIRIVYASQSISCKFCILRIHESATGKQFFTPNGLRKMLSCAKAGIHLDPDILMWKLSLNFTIIKNFFGLYSSVY